MRNVKNELITKVIKWENRLVRTKTLLSSRLKDTGVVCVCYQEIADSFMPEPIEILF